MGEVLELFKEKLSSLKENDKYKINELTFFARDHKDSNATAQNIVEVTIKHVYAIPSSLKLLGLYVIDSIVKNVSVPYRKLYTSSIVDAFVHSFQAIRDEKGRLKLYDLRTTWKDVFPTQRMYELDVRVREHDPAWPLIATISDTRASLRALPSIPKLQPKASEKIDTSESATLKQPKASLTESRDPRLNRKRKSSGPPEEDFLIDRSGDQKMEAVARKQGKQEVADQTKKVPLFVAHDLDMRPQPLTSPARSGVWSEYMGKHTEVVSRRELKDVDMRLSCPNIVKEKDKVSEFSCLGSQGIVDADFTPGKIGSPIIREVVPPSAPVAAKIASNIQDVSANRPDLSVVLPTSVVPNSGSEPTLFRGSHFSSPFDSQDVNKPHLPEPPRPRVSPDVSVILYDQNPPLFRRAPARPPMPPLPPINPSMAPPLRYERDIIPRQPRPYEAPYNGPPIRGPTWVVEIEGFPDMVNIGVDPRMLSLVGHPKPPRRITIDGRSYSLILDRVQPLIMVGNQVHAVRFRCEHATVLIDGRCFTIPGTGFTKVLVGWRRYQAYLGGPGHELIIDGKPHTIPLGPELTYITVGYNSVAVKFVGRPPRSVNVLPSIPPRLLKWAGQGLFGSPKSLHLPPLNPLSELARLAEGRIVGNNLGAQRPPLRSGFNNRIAANCKAPADESDMEHNASAPQPCPAEVTKVSAEMPVESTPPSVPQINVHELFQKLVQAGIVSQPQPEPKTPELKTYAWETFKVPCPSEVDVLYSGHQCGQCGLRFQSEQSAEFASHLDYHYMKNSRDDQGHRSRNFYQASRYWLFSEITRDGNAPFEPGTPVPDLQECKCPAFVDPSKNVCAVCNEKFDVFWDQEEEEWMLRDAVMVQDKVYHPICQEDAGKEFSVGNGIAHDMTEVPPAELDSETKPKLTEPADHSPLDENAFSCEDPSDSTQIPGLSPIREADSPEYLKPDPEPKSELSDTVSIKLEPTTIAPVPENISADPLAALKAVLQGSMSSLIQPPTTTS
ncbi:Pre-mRNA cleavage complex 2 protein Pcf11 [Fasciola gigantica]|uniref:Pre-mRNA cleavage complex 2 protein Pcf11 n=1 Tax=Fasciola gigantica TaxID=46835 RepID=A0A504YBZ4_FASGI|nr:Pre-mRNA cleavage complex 2 protein Pcf11 [Fasciola gigantica]